MTKVIGLGMESYGLLVKKALPSGWEYDNFEGNIDQLVAEVDATDKGAVLIVEFGPEYEPSTRRVRLIRTRLPNLPIIIASYYPMGLEAAANNNCVGMDISSSGPGWTNIPGLLDDAKALVAN